VFRGGVGNDGSNIINNIPVIPQMNFATTTNGTTANVTIPVCNGVVRGPCRSLLGCPNTASLIYFSFRDNHLLTLPESIQCQILRHRTTLLVHY
jgi:hypothetical protein